MDDFKRTSSVRNNIVQKANYSYGIVEPGNVIISNICPTVRCRKVRLPLPTGGTC